MATKRRKKAKATKHVRDAVWSDDAWKVVEGELKRGAGRPTKGSRLFKVVAEKLPVGCLGHVKAKLSDAGVTANGVYVAHDSMGTPRYIGRGNIFSRLKTHLKAHPRELLYFSFFVMEDRAHEREVETLLIRAAGDSLQFNDRKKRVGVAPGNVRDFEAGTQFYERQQKKGRKKGRKNRRKKGRKKRRKTRRKKARNRARRTT